MPHKNLDARRAYHREYDRQRAGDWQRKLDHLWSRHRMRVEDWMQMWIGQGGVYGSVDRLALCYLCERPMDPRFAVVDHDHRAGCGHDPRQSCRNCWRGLAHQRCNVMVGTFNDDPDLIRRVADNLEKSAR